jgi:hypothetical protein
MKTWAAPQAPRAKKVVVPETGSLF